MPEWIIPPRTEWPDNIYIATTSKELEEVGQLRYERYIARDRKGYISADHELRQFLDPADQVSLVFYARGASGDAIASVRLTSARFADTDPQMARLLRAWGVPDATVVTSRLVASDGFEAKQAVPRLFNLVYEVGYRSSAVWCILATRPTLTRLFSKFGFKPTGQRYVDPVATEQEAMALRLHDLGHLQQVESYLLETAEKLLGSGFCRRGVDPLDQERGHLALARA